MFLMVVRIIAIFDINKIISKTAAKSSSIEISKTSFLAWMTIGGYA